MTDYERVVLRLIERAGPDGITKTALWRQQKGPSMKLADALRALKAEGVIIPTDIYTRTGTVTRWRRSA